MLALTCQAEAKPSLSQLEKVEAAYLFNFSKFTQWPAKAFTSATGAIHLCLDDPRLMDFLAGLTDGRPVGAQRRVVKVVSLRDTQHCHISFFQHDLASPMPQLEGSLIVRHHSDTQVKGHVVTFFVKNDKLRFEVDLTELRHRELTLSSELLKLARIK